MASGPVKAGKKVRFLSGVQPSGKLHLGNHFGALKQHIELQEEGEAFYFIANYHAQTTVQDPEEMAGLVRDVALDYLALGLDPKRAVFFRQSDVPEVAELAWILSCVTPKGLLDRATSYKDKVQRGVAASMGLYFYPVLMAADILIYRSNVVPVGEDQVQHVEMTRDMAQAFNRTYGETLSIPVHRLDTGAKVPGIDGQKMSKSYDNTIDIFDEGKSLKKKVMSIVTDSTSLEAPKDPDKCNVFAIYSLIAGEKEREEMRGRYLAGGFGYGDAKKMLHERIEEYFRSYREERKRMEKDPSYVETVLAGGGARARAEAQATMRLVHAAAGFPQAPVAPAPAEG